VVAPDGQIVTEELTQQEAQDWLKRQIAQAKRDVESWPYWMKL
jgi:hypothetical protein